MAKKSITVEKVNHHFVKHKKIKKIAKKYGVKKDFVESIIYLYIVN